MTSTTAGRAIGTIFVFLMLASDSFAGDRERFVEKCTKVADLAMMRPFEPAAQTADIAISRRKVQEHLCEELAMCLSVVGKTDADARETAAIYTQCMEGR
jgi:hypothetical protein